METLFKYCWLISIFVLGGALDYGRADAGNEPAHKTRFAVVTGELTGATASDMWLLTGVAFDMEKRLGRLPGMEPVDRLALAGVLRASFSEDEKAKAALVMNRLNSDFVVYVRGSLTKSGSLVVTVNTWTGSSSPPTTHTCMGNPNHLFKLIEDLTGKVVAGLEAARIPSAACQPRPALRERPAKSVGVYRLVIDGMIALQSGRPADARSRLVSALEAEPDNWWAHYFLGAVEFHEGRLKEAAEECRKAIAIDPNLYAGVYANLAYCYQGLGQLEQARSAQREFEQRSGKPLPARSLPGGPFSTGYPETRK